MKIIQALKELKLIDKRIADNTLKITRYSSAVDGQPVFETELEQQREVDSLIQSNVDLVKRRSDLRLAIYKTNMQTEVDTVLGKFTIAEAIIMRDGGVKYLQTTYDALRDATGREALKQVAVTDPANPPKIKRYYKESDKNTHQQIYVDFLGTIDGILEVVNAETDLVE